MFGAWLMASPFVFRATADSGAYSASSFICGGLVMALSLLCFWTPLRYAHLGTLLVALSLAGHGYFAADRPGPPAAQNEIMTGLLLLLFAILPSNVNEPPRPWRPPVSHL